MNIGLITARGGSKGLPRKNILELNGMPLIAWTILAAKESKNIDRVFVTTEDAEIAEVSKSYGAEIIPRPMSLAEDMTSSEPVIEHAINYLVDKDLAVDNVCLLQPTSPMRHSHHIDLAFDKFAQEKADCVLSVFEPKHSAAKAYQVEEDGSIKGLLFDDAPYCRRQDLPMTLQPNGAIYLFSAEQFIENVQIPRKHVFPLIMSENDSADIDTAEDLKDVELLMKRKQNHD
ncbi:acylneuraminate cytidylyltransferase family protein [Photobacterium sp. J15]|uniref:acylneuraminate cytidylyltransferase family protein n=1 Tax=Photobacterium sp. J15 TaxID=265901 RepID=UPI0007E377FC|nr:acylneuraminate cytidylyltransferase family protein [Photobacterium sp. J15]